MLFGKGLLELHLTSTISLRKVEGSVFFFNWAAMDKIKFSDWPEVNWRIGDILTANDDCPNQAYVRSSMYDSKFQGTLLDLQRDPQFDPVRLFLGSFLVQIGQFT